MRIKLFIMFLIIALGAIVVLYCGGSTGGDDDTIPIIPTGSGDATGTAVGTATGTSGTGTGSTGTGTAVGTATGTAVGTATGTAVGAATGTAVGTATGTAVGTATGTGSVTPPGSTCSDPITIAQATPTGSGYLWQFDYDITDTVSTHVFSCDNYTGGDKILQYTAVSSGLLKISGTWISGYTGGYIAVEVNSSCTGGTSLFCQSSGTALSTAIPVIAGNTYYIWFGEGYGTEDFPQMSLYLEEGQINVGESCSNPYTPGLISGLNTLTKSSTLRVNPPSCFTVTGLNIDWYTYTPSNDTLTITTNASDHIAVINSVTGSQIYCSATETSFGISVIPGTTYCIAVETTGAITTLDILDSSVLPGESCGTAKPISIGNNAISISSTKRIGVPSCIASGNLEWYSYTTTNNSIQFTANAANSIGVFNAVTGSQLACPTNPTTIQWVNVTPGTQLCFAIGTTATITDIWLNDTHIGGENCADPVIIVSGTQVVSWLAISIDYTSYLDNASCDTGTIFTPDVVFTYTTGATPGVYVDIMISKALGQWVEYIVFNDCPDIGTEVACIRAPYDNPTITIPNALTNHTYYIVCVSYFNGDKLNNPATVVVNEIVPGAGENCANAQSLTTGLNTLSKISTHRIMAPSCFTTGTSNVDWYTYTFANQNITFSVNSSDHIAVFNFVTGSQIYCGSTTTQTFGLGAGTQLCFAIESTGSINTLTIEDWVPILGEDCTNPIALTVGTNTLAKTSLRRVGSPSCMTTGNLEWYSFTPLNNHVTFTPDATDQIGVFNSLTGIQLLCITATANVASYYLVPTSGLSLCIVVEATTTIANIVLNDTTAVIYNETEPNNTCGGNVLGSVGSDFFVLGDKIASAGCTGTTDAYDYLEFIPTVSGTYTFDFSLKPPYNNAYVNYYIIEGSCGGALPVVNSNWSTGCTGASPYITPSSPKTAFAVLTSGETYYLRMCEGEVACFYGGWQVHVHQ